MNCMGPKIPQILNVMTKANFHRPYRRNSLLGKNDVVSRYPGESNSNILDPSELEIGGPDQYRLLLVVLFHFVGFPIL